MQDLILCAGILAPVFMLVGLGYALRLLHITNDNFIEVGSNLLFFVFLPCSLFMNLYNSNFTSIWNPKLALFVVVTHVCFTLLLAFLLPRFFKEREKCGIIIQGAFRGNVILLGLPLAISMYGSSGTGTTSVIMAYSIPLYNILGVAILAIFYDGKENKKINWGNILFKIIKNPLVIATLAALPFALTGARLPALPTTVIQNVGGIASAFGLMLLGAQMRISSIHKNKAPIAAAVVLKLVVFPLAVLSLAVLFGFTKIEIGSLFILTAAPMSVSSFIMANNMGGEGELAGQMVVISTICSMLTMLVGLYILKLFGVI